MVTKSEEERLQEEVRKRKKFRGYGQEKRDGKKLESEKRRKDR